MFEQLLAALLFTFTASVTPGPNNVMLMTSGVNFGFRRTLPHASGVVLGFAAMVMIIGFGLGTILTTTPWLHDAVTLVGAVYLAWLAWRIGAAPVERGLGMSESAARPLNFLEAVTFQWVNPKGWIMAVGALAVYAPSSLGPIAGVLAIASLYLLVGIVSSTIWTGFGSLLAGILSTPTRLRAFNVVMAALLLVSLVPPLLEWWSRAHPGV